MKSDNPICSRISGMTRLFITLLLSLMLAIPAMAQTRDVTGVVTDKSGEPLVGATVKVKGSDQTVITDIDGRFNIKASPSQTLEVHYLGYATAEVKADKTPLNVALHEDAAMLDDVVVIGYGTARKETLTGAVSAVTNKEITITKNESVINMLSGKLAGVRIQQMSSQPGDFQNNIDIRGMGAPLIVVDGVPRDQDYFARMDANEIEQVSVLKDASAAIYGVRAANGVILVTTKHGGNNRDGKVDITFQANIGWQGFLYMPETADAVTHMLMINEKTYNGFGNNYPVRTMGKYSWDQMFAYSSGQKKSTNWTKEMFKDYVPQQQYNLAIDGGSDRINYYFNLGYMKQDGAYRSGSLNYDRWNFRSNIDAKITNNLKANLQLGGYIDETNQPGTADMWTVYKMAWTYRPTAEAYVDGNRNYPSHDSEMGGDENPVASTDATQSGYRTVKRRNFTGQISLIYDIPWVKGLSAKALYNYDYNTTDNTTFIRQYSLYTKNADGTYSTYNGQPGSPRVERSTNPSHATLLNLSLNYNRKFGDHNLGVLALFEETYNTWTDFSAIRTMLLNSEYLFAGEDEGQIGRSGGVGDITRRAWIGKIDYDYQGKYLLNLAARYDASSRYPKNGRWGFFPSVAAGWRISEESFIKNNVDFIDNLKLRASWGRLGDDSGASTYPATVVGYEVTTNLGWYYNGAYMTGVNPTALPNPNWTWYVANTWNVGLDWDLWNRKFTGTVEGFVRNRSGLPATSDRALPNIVGATMPQENREKDRTFGWEIQLGHYNRIGEVNYYVSVQLSATKTRWIDVLSAPYATQWGMWRDWGSKQSNRNTNIWSAVQEGGRWTSYDQIRNHPYLQNYGQGLNGALPGDYWYEDWNGDGVVDGNDEHPVATRGMPVFNYGVTLGADWRGFDLSMNWQGAANVYNTYNEIFSEVGPFNGMAVLDMYTDRWHTANYNDDPWNPSTQWIEGYYPATGHQFNAGTTGIHNTSFIRLKSLEVGYTFPWRWIHVAGLNNLRLYFNCYNLLTISKQKDIDPERPGEGANKINGAGGMAIYNYPMNRVFNIGVTARF